MVATLPRVPETARGKTTRCAPCGSRPLSGGSRITLDGEPLHTTRRRSRRHGRIGSGLPQDYLLLPRCPRLDN
ncbi:hypothetical protein [Nonomuraea dietziae]|uniref:hypothetical protein n=1 Tax=Nonomuraea dietziae TaxID=65515 RepID=UPI0031E02634